MILRSQRCIVSCLRWRKNILATSVCASRLFCCYCYKTYPVYECKQGLIRNFVEARRGIIPNGFASTVWCITVDGYRWTSGSFLRSLTRRRHFSGSTHVDCKQTSGIVKERRELKVLTVPNVLCLGRIAASPVLGYLVIHGNYLAGVLLFMAASVTDVLDGFIARKFPSQMSYLGSVLDPVADKVLVGVLTISLLFAHLIPVPLAVIMLGRDMGLIIASFAVRFVSLPQPRTLSRFFDFQLPTVQVTPSPLGKVNTALQLALISLTLAAPLVDMIEHFSLIALQYTVGISTIVSGIDYFITRRGYSILENKNQ